jgi:hypothetical protein
MGFLCQLPAKVDSVIFVIEAFERVLFILLTHAPAAELVIENLVLHVNACSIPFTTTED